MSDSPGRTVLSIEGGNLSAPKRIPCELAAGAARQFFLDLPSGAAAVQARLEEDALAIDNQVWLLPDPTPPVRVRLDLADGALRAAVARAVRATGMALEVAARPDLVVCDRSAAADGDAWRLEITGGAATAYAGPFVLDRTHPLAHGLSLEGIVWAAAPTAQLSGTALVTPGNVTLLSDREDNSGRRRLQMNFAPGLSNLQDMPDWPILFDNLLRWRRGAHPGAAVANVRLGQTVTVTLGEDVRQVELLPPAPPARTLDVHGRRVEVPADRTGLYAVKTPGATYSFACNAISRDESDLSAARTGRWGDWNGSPLHRDRQIRMRWMFLLLGMACLAAHLVVIAENSRSDTP